MKRYVKTVTALFVALILAVSCGCTDRQPAGAPSDAPAPGETSSSTGCNHVRETIPGYAPTKTEPGLTDGVKCSLCGKILVKQETIAATGIWNGSTAKEVAGGSGTQEDPYLISNGAQLAFLSSICTAEKACFGEFFKLTDDIDLGNRQWVPIAYFSGVFDGDGHTVSSFKITSSELTNAGLFGRLDGAIKNLSVTAFDINCTKKIRYAGGIAGSISKSDIYNHQIQESTFAEWGIFNCHVQGSISAKAITEHNDLDIGGITGSISGGTVGDTEITVSGCSADVNITGYIEKNNGAPADVNAGGIVGYIHNGFSSIGDRQHEVSDCYSKGEITADGYAQYNNVGGIVGLAQYKNIHIKNCYSVANVTATTVGASQLGAGGIVGARYSDKNENVVISGCITFGNVKATARKIPVCVGDIVGRMWEKENPIINCYYYEGQTHTAESEGNRTFNIKGGKCSLDTVNDSTLYTATMHWSEEVWDFSDLDVANGKYPTLINAPSHS